MKRLASLAACLPLALVLCAAPAHAVQTVNGNPGSALGDLATLNGGSLSLADSFLGQASFIDDYTFTVGSTTSGSGIVGAVDLTFNPSSGSLSQTNLSALMISVFSGTAGGTHTLIASLSDPSGGQVSFSNLSPSNNPYYLEISGTPASNTVIASYAGVVTAAAVPEPGTWALFAAGVFGMSAFARRRRA